MVILSRYLAHVGAQVYNLHTFKVSDQVVFYLGFAVSISIHNRRSNHGHKYYIWSSWCLLPKSTPSRSKNNVGTIACVWAWEIRWSNRRWVRGHTRGIYTVFWASCREFGCVGGVTCCDNDWLDRGECGRCCTAPRIQTQSPLSESECVWSGCRAWKKMWRRKTSWWERVAACNRNHRVFRHRSHLNASSAFSSVAFQPAARNGSGKTTPCKLHNVVGQMDIQAPLPCFSTTVPKS